MKFTTFLNPMGATDIYDLNYLTMTSNMYMKQENLRREGSSIKSSNYMNHEGKKIRQPASIRDITKESRGMLDTITEDSEQRGNRI